MSLYKKNGKVRWLPSFFRHQGKTTKAQKRAIQTLWPKYGIGFSYNKIISLFEHFPKEEPISLEIGFGKGENLIYLAEQNPNKQYSTMPDSFRYQDFRWNLIIVLIRDVLKRLYNRSQSEYALLNIRSKY